MITLALDTSTRTGGCAALSGDDVLAEVPGDASRSHAERLPADLMAVLERARLISRGRHAQWRPCRIEAGPLKNVAEWTEKYRHIWEERLGRLDTYLQELKAKEKKHGRKRRSK